MYLIGTSGPKMTFMKGCMKLLERLEDIKFVKFYIFFFNQFKTTVKRLKTIVTELKQQNNTKIESYNVMEQTKKAKKQKFYSICTKKKTAFLNKNPKTCTNTTHSAGHISILKG